MPVRRQLNAPGNLYSNTREPFHMILSEEKNIMNVTSLNAPGMMTSTSDASEVRQLW